MSRKATPQDATSKRGGKREGAGRKPSGKIKLTVHILPETRAALGDKPGEAIDALVR